MEVTTNTHARIKRELFQNRSPRPHPLPIPGKKPLPQKLKSRGPFRNRAFSIPGFLGYFSSGDRENALLKNLVFTISGVAVNCVPENRKNVF